MLPLGDRRRLPQLVCALPDENAHQCGGHALSHRPAFERRVLRDAGPVPLADETPSPRHHERRRHPRRRLERRIDGALHLCRIELRRERRLRQRIAHRPFLRRGVGKPFLDPHGFEIHLALSLRQRHASLVSKVLRRARDAVRQFDVHSFSRTIDHRLSDLRSLLVRAGEVADVLGGKVRVQAGDEHCRAHDLGEARRVMAERVSRRRHIHGVQLERFRSRDQRLARRCRRRDTRRYRGCGVIRSACRCTTVRCACGRLTSKRESQHDLRRQSQPHPMHQHPDLSCRRLRSLVVREPVRSFRGLPPVVRAIRAPRS